jgi:protein phosphatase
MSEGHVIASVVGITDVGRSRAHNEDALAMAELSRAHDVTEPVQRHEGPGPSVFMVADGMGGAAAGEIASAMATEIVLEEMRAAWHAASLRSSDVFARTLCDAVSTANLRIHQFALSNPRQKNKALAPPPTSRSARPRAAPGPSAS